MVVAIPRVVLYQTLSKEVLASLFVVLCVQICVCCHVSNSGLSAQQSNALLPSAMCVVALVSKKSCSNFAASSEDL